MRVRHLLGNSPNVMLVLTAGLSLGGCALAPFDEDGLFRKTTTAAGMTGKLAEPAPFVKESRPAELAYQPVGVTPTRPTNPRTSAGVQQLEQELRQQQAQSAQQAARPVPPSPYDGKIEPGFKPPPPPPLPEGKAPEVGLRGAQPAAAPAQAVAPAPAARAAAKKTTNDKNIPTKKKQQDGADTH